MRSSRRVPAAPPGRTQRTRSAQANETHDPLAPHRRRNLNPCRFSDTAFISTSTSVGQEYSDTLSGTTCGSGAGTSCESLCAAASSSPACTRYLVSSCANACCESPTSPVLLLQTTPPNSTTCSTTAVTYWTTAGTVAINAFTPGTLQYCNLATGAVLADPHFFGFDGTPFFFDGKDDAVFALLSEPEHQVNALFGSVGPKAGVDSTIWMLGFGVRVRDELALSVHIDADPEDIRLFRDERAKHGTKMRVALPERRFLHIELNGRHADALLYSGKVLRPSPAVLLYFPPASAVNPDDATAGERAPRARGGVGFTASRRAGLLLPPGAFPRALRRR